MKFVLFDDQAGSYPDSSAFGMGFGCESGRLDRASRWIDVPSPKAIPMANGLEVINVTTLSSGKAPQAAPCRTSSAKRGGPGDLRVSTAAVVVCRTSGLLWLQQRLR